MWTYVGHADARKCLYLYLYLYLYLLYVLTNKHLIVIYVCVCLCVCMWVHLNPHLYLYQYLYISTKKNATCMRAAASTATATHCYPRTLLQLLHPATHTRYCYCYILRHTPAGELCALREKEEEVITLIGKVLCQLRHDWHQSERKTWQNKKQNK